ncbi:MAG: abortive infection system antitoxin AbiGi family protein [Marinomonas foliarum]|uniref:abortive infection system antitoxin AbiGi family protein n=1 Tax=Marinomonas foliarum TaxID=491950 RepID=UPI003F98359B
MKPKSHTLFHFTKNAEILKSILKGGFWPRYCLEDITWYTNSETQIAFPMICFCDIPLSRLDEHVGFYGEYGVGVSKEWALSNDCCPVIYLPKNSQISLALLRITKGNLAGKGYYEGSNGDMNALISNVKPIEGRMLVNGELISKEFYQESEWRHVIKDTFNRAKARVWLSESEFHDENFRKTENNKTKEFHSLKISPSDIKYLFVKNESDIPGLVNFIQNELDYFSGSDIKILLSKIISLETIREDL